LLADPTANTSKGWIRPKFYVVFFKHKTMQRKSVFAGVFDTFLKSESEAYLDKHDLPQSDCTETREADG